MCLLIIHQPHHENTCFNICKNKDAVQLCSYYTADQHLCFCISDSTNFLNPNFLSPSLLDLTGGLVSGLVINLKDRVSHGVAHVIQELVVLDSEDKNIIQNTESINYKYFTMMCLPYSKNI